MSLYAANNIAKGVRRLARRGEVGLAGIICNSSGDELFERSMLAEFAQALGTQWIDFIPRSPVIQACEVEGRTVLEHSPSSPEAEVFQRLAVCRRDSDFLGTNGPTGLNKPLILA
jgi:nitrogenase iron protein NifH